MPTLLNDWCVFCKGRTYFDKSHFLALFKVHSSLPEITKALSYFPQADSLVSRVNEVIQLVRLTISCIYARRLNLATLS